MSQDENQELSVVESKFVFTPEVFDPNVDQLEAIKKEVSAITADPKTITKEELTLVSDTRKKLMKARTRIKAIGEAEREASNKYSKDVLEYQKKLIGIVEPEEKRLKEIEDDAKAYALRESRREQLPELKEKLLSINGTMPKITDDELLDMDTTQFQQFYNDCREEHFDTVQREKEEREAKEAEEKAAEEKRIAEQNAEADRKIKEANLAIYNSRVQQLLSIGMSEFGLSYMYPDSGATISQGEIKELSNEDFSTKIEKFKSLIQVKKEAEAKIESERIAKEKQEAVEQAKREAEAKAQAEKEAAEKARQEQEAAEQAKKEAEAKAEAEAKVKRESEERFQNWLQQFDYSESTHMIVEKDGKSLLYKFIDEYHHNV